MIRLRGMTWDHPRGLAPLVGLGPLYAESHPDVEIEWAARSLQAFADRPLEELADTYDLLVIDHPHVPSVADRGLLVELDGEETADQLTLLSRQSVGHSHDSYRHKGHQYGLAIDAAAQVAAYRPDLLTAAPTTWEEVDALLDEGSVLWPAKPVDAMSSFLTLLAHHGAPICGAEGVAVDDDAGRRALCRLHRLADSVPESCLDEDPVATAERLASGDRWAYAPLLFGYTNYSRQHFRDHRIAYGAPPLGPTPAGSCLGGAGIAVSARGEHVEAAVEYAFWLASAETQAGGYYRYGGQPANAVAWEDPVVNADSLDFFAATRETLELAAVRPRAGWWLALQDEIGRLVNAALRRRSTDRDCLDGIAACYRQLTRSETP